MKNRISCYECDSEYTVQYQPGSLTDEIQYCIVCSTPLDIDTEEESE